MNNKFSYLSIILDIILYGILGALLAVLQTTLMPRLTVFYAVADIIIGAICCIGIYKGENTAALFGLWAGLCVEALGSTDISLLPLFYTLVGYVCGRIGFNARNNARFAAYLVSLPLLCLSRTAFSFVFHLLRYFGSIDFKMLFVYTLLPEFLYTLVICIPVFILVKALELPIYAIRKRGGLY
ncbi:MAG: hypothetical protein IKU48_00465 [Clostridia bacterium]|nr:hypothetical protein [Clostridia bacterium]